MKNSLVKYVNFLFNTSFGNGFGGCAVVFPILIFGFTFAATGFITIMFILGFIFHFIIYNSDKLKKFLDI